jgi:Rap1a immunity proteins
MRMAVILLMVLIAAAAALQEARASGSARDLANNCQSLERGSTAKGQHVRIPNTKEALLCWGYMQAIQDLSVVVDQDGHRLLGSCPPEQTTLLQLIHSFMRYARSHPGELQGSAGVAVIKALEEAFPCHQVNASVQRYGFR